jgi:hypothetical protein
MIFAREVSGPLTSLVKKLDEATGRNQGARMGSFVVFCSDDEKLEKQLRELAEKEKIQHLVLTIDNPAGPQGYKIARDADVTVVLYTGYTVKANHSFKKGELDGKAIDKIMADLPKIVPEKQ